MKYCTMTDHRPNANVVRNACHLISHRLQGCTQILMFLPFFCGQITLVKPGNCVQAQCSNSLMRVEAE